MARTSKIEKTSTVSVPAPAVETTTLSVSVAPVEKKQRKPKAEKVVPVDEPVAVAPVVPVVESVVDEAVAPVVVPLLEKLSDFSSKLLQLSALTSALKTEYKALEKAVAKEQKKSAQKGHKKKATGNRQPSGFVKPTLITDELAHFLGKSVGSKLARTDVSKEINAYIRANSLQDKANGRHIIPDVKLSTLLKIKDGDELTYFNLQRYMKHHFIKEVAVVDAVTA